jgi:Tol biopolymer transport system component
MLGLGGFDLATGERLRFSYNVEDALPTWAPAGDQLFFASTRYGDGRWRLYQVWADGNGNATDMRYGQDPAWHPQADLLVYKGCDEAGGHCGLWLMRPDGADRRSLTDNPGDARPNPANDGLPTISPDGTGVAFVSDRDGAWAIWTAPLAGGAAGQLVPIGQLPNWLDQGLDWVQ